MRICPKCTSIKIITKTITERRINWNSECIDCKYKDKKGTNV